MLTEANERREAILAEEEEESDEEDENDVDDGTMVRRSSQLEVDDGTLVKDGRRRRGADEDTLRRRKSDDDDDGDFRTAKEIMAPSGHEVGGHRGGGDGTMTSISTMIEVESSIGTMVINESSDDAESTVDDDEENDSDGGEERRRRKKEDKEKNRYRPPFLDHFDRRREKEILIDRHLRGEAGGGDVVGDGTFPNLDANGVNFSLNSMNTPSYDELLRSKGESMERRFLNGAEVASRDVAAGGVGEVDFNTASSINSSGTFVRHHEGDTPIPSPAGTFVQHDSIDSSVAQPPINAYLQHIGGAGIGYDESSFDPAGWTPVDPRQGSLQQQRIDSSLSSAASTAAGSSFYYNNGSSMQIGSSAHTHPSGPIHKLSQQQIQQHSQQQQYPQQQSHPSQMPPQSRCDVVDGPFGSEVGASSTIDPTWTFHKIMQGEFDFLKSASYEELQQRLNLVDRECENELELLKRRYNVKRLPILSAIDAKRKRQQNF